MNQTKIVISIDAMGSERGPKAVVDGILKSAGLNPNVEFIVHGEKKSISKLVKNSNLQTRCQILNANYLVSMHDKPSQIIRNGKKTSMWSAIESVKQGKAQVCVSCGNTGALMALSMFRLRRLDGVNRPAIACLWPSLNKLGYNIVLDVGADIKADQNDLFQYAMMGLNYARKGFGIKKPRIGILNVGTEEHKGRSELKLAYDLISSASDKEDFEFVGFVEGNDIPSEAVDIIVTDGFTGNIAIKTAEGTANLIASKTKTAFKTNFISKLGGLLAASSLINLKKEIDPRQVNGGIFLGLNGIVIKSHGSADGTGIASAINLGISLAKSGFYSSEIKQKDQLNDKIR